MPPKQSKIAVKFDLLIKELNYFEKNIKECSSEVNRITVLKSKVVEYEVTLTKLFSELSNYESDEYFDQYMQFKDQLMNWSINLEDKISVNVSQVVNNNNEREKSVVVQLPKLEIPHFYGNPADWISFKEIFKSTILENKSLNDVEKLQYLQSTIRGDASKLIRGFSITPENLQNCWEILIGRFENKRQLAISQINKVFNGKVGKATNAKSLLELVDVCNESIRNLKALGFETNALTDLMLINHLTSKIDDEINHRWELTMDNNKIPSIDEFKSFIEREARSMTECKSKPEVKKLPVKPWEKKIHVNNTIVNKHVDQDILKYNQCSVCKQGQVHGLFKCAKFNSMSVKERWKIVRENALCENCLRSNHTVERCRIGISCKNCTARHHTLLHIYAPNPQESIPLIKVSQNLCTKGNHVLLSTALINVKGKNGKIVTCRALIDSASQNSLITKDCANKLNLNLKHSNHRLVGINETSAEVSLFSTIFEFYSLYAPDTLEVQALVVSKVTTSLPNFPIKGYNWPHIERLNLADPSFHSEGAVDILLGADIFSLLITGSPIIGPKGTPSALPTKLGYLLSGRIETPVKTNSSVSCHSLTSLDSTLKQFWELEAVPTTISSKSNDEDQLCEEIFTKFHKRDCDGRYILKLPFREKICLGDSKNGAINRFFNLERKIQSDGNLRKQYIEFMDEYINLGHMTPVGNDQQMSGGYVLPHHGVINEHSSTTKLRVVFDGSFKSTNGQSLNDNLLKGEKLQTDIFKILTNFRTFVVAFSADINKMYRQILIDDEDTKFQKILWRKSPTDPLRTYRLKTVTYGTSCAPFLAIRTIKQLCRDEYDRFPQAAKIAMDSFYVDDLLSGADSTESAKILIQELYDLMFSGGFSLRKWTCSHPEALADLSEDLKASHFLHSFQDDTSSKILGIFWNLKEDSFQIRAIPTEQVSTKRHLLSVIARTFDPLGFIAPATIILKLIIQEVWKTKLDWDDPIPTEIIAKWHKFASEMNCLQEIQIPRYIHSKNAIRIEAHGFCDASSRAYAAVIFLRVVAESTKIFLMTSKTRVAPIQTVTLPRLELCGALLLAELLNTFKSSINLTINEIFLWCDSTITLSWINNPPVKGNQFVAHRVNKINALTTKQSWHHIPGKLNPADCATRGLFPQALKNYSEWLVGPSWLVDFDSHSLSDSFKPTDTNLSQEEERDLSSDSIILVTETDLTLLEKFSSYTKLIHIVAWILRFQHNSLSTSTSRSKITGFLQPTEISKAIKVIVKSLQQKEYQAELSLLKHQKPLPKQNKLISLNPFVDSDGILRVGGRLRQHSNLTFSQKHPMLLPKGHHLTKLLIRHIHETNFHAGQDLVLSLIRQTFWIPDGKSTVRKELRQCITCFKAAAKPINQLMGDLPPSRIQPCRAFERVGIDFAGPVTTKCQHIRKSTQFKSYIALFICMCTKAVHLELVSSLSSAAFLAALRRFVARRGCPTDLFSDNGTNFVGASAYLKNLFALAHNSDIQNFTSHRNIQWHFIPPYAPHFGGVWEASIKLTKSHLQKTTKSAVLNFEELTTLLCQIEACINSRPLCPLSPDPKDLTVLTPGHFLIGSPLVEINEKPNTHVCLSSHSRWKLLLHMKNQFWTSWSTSYLHTLQSRPKWKSGHTILCPGTMVLVKDPTANSTTWNLGRITATHPGQDGITRTVTIRTQKGLITRSVSQVALLPQVEHALRPPEHVE